MAITQSIGDEVSYQFNVLGLGELTVSSAEITSDKCDISDVGSDSEAVFFAISNPASNSFDINIKITLSNGDIENKTVPVIIAPTIA